MTKYRTVSNGYYDELEYQKEFKFLFFKRNSWHSVWRPYYDEIWGRTLDYRHNYINSINTNIKDFVTKWPNIKNYFDWALEEQEKLEEKINKERIKIELKKQEVKYF